MTDEIGPKTWNVETVLEAVLEAPFIYMDGAANFAANAQIVKFNLFQDRVITRPPGSDQPPIERVVCARLAMSPLTLLQLAQWLGTNAQQMIQAVAAEQPKNAESS
jgi:hypothetical protein